ncbi:MAG TPA: hypothetical protein VFT50_16300 [Baekduia sp.]|nr:hypothetical protein [Baekduia sp.]
MPIPTCVKAGCRMLARWPGLAIHAATIRAGVPSAPEPQARSSPALQLPAEGIHPTAVRRICSVPPSGET